MKLRRAVVLLLLATTACAGIRGPRGNPLLLPRANEQAGAQFDAIASLDGDWAWAPSLGPELAGHVVSYRLTAGGSAVVEVLFPGTPHEMLTMYHRDGDQLMLTHYCSTGNQPSMLAKPSAPGEPIAFECIGGTSFSEPDGHMHSMSFLRIGRDELLSRWTYHEGRASGGDRVFHLVRIPYEETGRAQDRAEAPAVEADLLAPAEEAFVLDEPVLEEAEGPNWVLGLEGPEPAPIEQPVEEPAPEAEAPEGPDPGAGVVPYRA